MDTNETLDYLIQFLLKENKNLQNVKIPDNYEDKKALFRSLMNLHMPYELDEEFLEKQDEFLQWEMKRKNITSVNDIKPLYFGNRIALWQGDITLLEADAIVNAANEKLLGCFVPMHNCIDNAIHSAAGLQLRMDCMKIMKKQGRDENAGQAKLTNAYNLPSKYVIHTVGPIVSHGTCKVPDKAKKELSACYISCLERAKNKGDIDTLAFCAISTGVYGFPKKEAAETAISTVVQWLNENNNPFSKIIFNVFLEEDYHIYEKYLKVK